MKAALLAFMMTMGPGTLFAQGDLLKGTCILTYKGKNFAQGECTGDFTDQHAITIKETVPENGVTSTAIIDQTNSRGLLLGAGTFILANGPMELASGGAIYYAIDAAFDLAE